SLYEAFAMVSFKTYFKLVDFAERLIELKFPPINCGLLRIEQQTMIRKSILIHCKRLQTCQCSIPVHHYFKVFFKVFLFLYTNKYALFTFVHHHFWSGLNIYHKMANAWLYCYYI